MKRILIPTESAEDWKRLLAKPELHWKRGYSAMSLALSWEDAHPKVPPEVDAALRSAKNPLLTYLDLLLAIPEYQVDLPGGSRPSQTDVLALMRGTAGLVTVAVEGKVDEPFGPTVGEKLADPSPGVERRMMALKGKLGLSSIPNGIRYQLLHRTVSALLVAEQFSAAATVMLVHSFSPTDMRFDDFEAFAQLVGVECAIGEVVRVPLQLGTPLFIGWAKGKQGPANGQ